MVAAKLTGHAVEADTARWLAELQPATANKLAAVGLIPKRERTASAALGPFCESYIAGRANLKPNTKRNYEATKRLLVEHFGAGRPLSSITPGDADDWRETLLKRLSAATVSREVKRARQFFRAAVRRRLIAENPFVDLSAPAQVNSSREHFIGPEDTLKLLAACPDSQWRLIVALSRFGGLRCPSEHLALTWADVDWQRGRLTVHSSKTAHHAGRESRVVPMFPELRRYVEQAWDEAEPGATYLITRYRDANCNLRSQFLRIIKRAGLAPWPRVFHNLRATRQTELTSRFPLHVVCAWLGNSAPIADRHYLQVTDDHFDDGARQHTVGTNAAKATQNPTQQAHAESGFESHAQMADVQKPLELPSIAASGEILHNCPLPPRGVEPLFSG